MSPPSGVALCCAAVGGDGLAFSRIIRLVDCPDLTRLAQGWLEAA